jgi:Arc/MetJ-type ribon-helix-helix transcriptional regulator
MGKKYKIGVTISPYLKERADQLIEEQKFSSMSDLMSVALAKFLGEYDKEQKDMEHKTEIALSRTDSPGPSYLHSPEGRALIKSVIMEAFSPSDGPNNNKQKKTDQKEPDCYRH